MVTTGPGVSEEKWFEIVNGLTTEPEPSAQVS